MCAQLWTGHQARAIDQLSIERYGVDGLSLMEEAGRAVFHKILLLRRPFQEIAILVGPGNNGGDALVAARLLVEAALSPLVYSVMDPSSQESPARKIQRQRYEALGLSLKTYRNAEDFAVWSPSLMVVDGLLGLGVKAPLRPGAIAYALEAAATQRPQCVLAIDLPSGLDPDRWDIDAILPATHTLSFGAFKPVHLFGHPGNCGELSVSQLAFHPAAIAESLNEGPQLRERDASLEKPWSKLASDAHKYSRGHVLIIGGSPGKVGALLLSARAALRAGAGWVSCAPLSLELAPPLHPAFTYEGWALERGLTAEKLIGFIRERRVKSLLIGPGTMQNPCSRDLLAALAAYAQQEKLFIVFDAGALRDWDTLTQGLCFDPKQTLLTPHPGEWKAIASQHQDLNSLSALDAAWAFCARKGVSLCYKSSRPLTLSSMDGKEQLRVNTTGDNRLAKAGSGDVLAGVALAFGAAGLAADAAAYLAQEIVANAAVRASERFGLHGLSPEDLSDEIGTCLDRY